MRRYAHFRAFALLVCIPIATLAQPRFSVQDIGDLDGGENYSRAYGMNANGQVVGESWMSYSPDAESSSLLVSSQPSWFDPNWAGRRGFVWSQGTLNEVGPITRVTGTVLELSLTTPTPITRNWSLDLRFSGSARAIDDGGNIYVESGQRGADVFQLNPVGIIESQELFVGSPAVSASTLLLPLAVNSVSGNGNVGGFVAGGAATWNTQTGTRALLAGAGGGFGSSAYGVPETRVNGVNNNGIAAGVSGNMPVWWDAQGQVRELPVFTSTSYGPSADHCAGLPDCHVLVMQGTSPLHVGSATAINNHDAIVGTSDEGGFLWENGHLTRLNQGNATLDPMGINDQGEIVGSFAGGRAVLRTTNGTFLDLNTAVDSLDGWTFTEAVAINASGQIAVNGSRAGITHAFLLSPVPEPTLAWMFLVGLPLLAARSSRYLRHDAGQAWFNWRGRTSS